MLTAITVKHSILPCCPRGHCYGLVTALNPGLGYERSAAIAKEALKTGASVHDLVLDKKWMTKEQLDDMLRPENMTDPRKIPKK